MPAEGRRSHAVSTGDQGGDRARPAGARGMRTVRTAALLPPTRAEVEKTMAGLREHATRADDVRHADRIRGAARGRVIGANGNVIVWEVRQDLDDALVLKLIAVRCRRSFESGF